MTTARSGHDPALCERLIFEAREDDHHMQGGMWSTVGTGSILEIESSILHLDGANVGVAEDLRAADARGIVRTRNNLALLADQLEAAMTRIVTLQEKQNALLVERDGLREQVDDWIQSARDRDS